MDDFTHDPRSVQAKSRDLIPRGVHKSTPIGRTVFVLGRVVDPLIQYSILAHGMGTGLLHRVGLRTLPLGVPSPIGIAAIDALGLSPYRLVLLGMSVGSVVKQNIHMTMLGDDPLSVPNALIISAFMLFWNSMNSYAFLNRASSASTESTFPQPAFLVGGALYVTGIVTELVAEIQRKRFKSDPKNQGKPYTGGLWRFARHINYGAYTMWRAGYAMASGGWLMGAVIGAFFFSDFARRGVPILDEYCAIRYGEQWEQFKKQTKYRLIPGIY